MQHSENNTGSNARREKAEGQDLAVLFESLYIANLLILPVIAFMVLVYFFMARHHQLPALARSHLEQTISAGLWIAVMFLLGGVSIMIMRLSGIEDVTLWIIVVLVFTMIHATMVLLGIFGLSRALNGHCWRYPLVGRPLPRSCDLADET